MGDIKGNVRGFQHLGIPASDIEKSIRFYSAIGLSIVDRYTIDENGGVTKVAFMKVGDFCIELYQPSASQPRGAEAGPINHLAFDVVDIDKTFADVKAAGFKPLDSGPISLPLKKNGVRYFMIPGPDGERVEFNQIL